MKHLLNSDLFSLSPFANKTLTQKKKKKPARGLRLFFFWLSEGGDGGTHTHTMAERSVLYQFLSTSLIFSLFVIFFVYNRHVVPVGRRAMRRVRWLNWLKVLEEGTHFIFPLFAHIHRDGNALAINLPSESDKGTMTLEPYIYDLGPRKVEVVVDVEYWIAGDAREYVATEFDPADPPREQAASLARGVLADFTLQSRTPTDEIYGKVLSCTTRRAATRASTTNLAFSFTNVRVCNVILDARSAKSMATFGKEADEAHD